MLIAEDGGRYCARLYHIGAGNERLDIPPLLFNDGPRGIGMGNSTCFPVPMARGASFDVDLERATPKHFAVNSMENARFTVDVTVDEATLREVYLRHFKYRTAEQLLSPNGFSPASSG